MGKLGKTTEEVAEYFKRHDCELLDEYNGVYNKMKYRCSCGVISYTTWNNFKYGKRCGYCVKQGQKKKRSLEEVQRIFKERNCEFLDDEFKGVHYKHRYRCKCGQEAAITFIGFYHQNQNCRECGRKKNLGSGNPAWAKDREALALKKKVRKKCYSMLSHTLHTTNKNKVGKTSDMLGYTPLELQQHLTNHPNWEKVKDGNWHLDHIFPIEAFVEYKIYDIKIINHLDNLRPLSQHENNVKKDKCDKEEFEKWLKEHNII